MAQDATTLQLTEEERTWLDAHPALRVGPAPNFPPVEFFDETGAYQGIAADYVALFEQRLGITFAVQRRNTWQEVVESTRRGEIDIWFEAGVTPERTEFLDFTDPYIRLPSVIVVRDDETATLDVDDLRDRRVVAVEGYAIVDYLRDRVPELELVTVASIDVGLQRVAFGSADAMVVSLPPASYYIERLGLTNLRVAGESGYVWELAIGSTNRWPILNSILQKTLNSISPDERRAIYRRWVSLEAPSSPTIKLEVLIGVLAALVLVAAWFRLARLLRGRRGCGGSHPPDGLE
jgi:ABC-type amino acid transport substrate-binding protein